MIEPLIDNCLPNYRSLADKYISRQKRSHYSIIISIISLFIASFLAFQDIYNELKKERDAHQIIIGKYNDITGERDELRRKLNELETDSAKSISSDYSMGNVNNNLGVIAPGMSGGSIINNPTIKEPNGLYQSGNKVATVQKPSIDKKNGIINFQVVTFNTYPESDLFEYGKFITQCDNIPIQSKDMVVGALIQTYMSYQCKIISQK